MGNYLKKVSLKSFSSSEEETALKPGDFVLDKYETNTLNKLLIITKLGNYIFLPIHEIISCKWKELGKHVSNYVSINPDDTVIKSFVISESNKERDILIYTKLGMVKKTKLKEFIVSRYSKTYTSMKLKEKDEIINATFDNDFTILVTKLGYYLNYSTKEIPNAGTKASGVKGISLKEDFLVKGLTYNETDEYLAVFTNKNTAKRIKLSELKSLNRAKRGSTLIKKVKSTNYEIINTFIVNKNDHLGLVDDEIKLIKSSDIAIMDDSSTGSIISKSKYNYVYKDNGIISIDEDKIEMPKTKEEIKEMTIDDFINDFKL